MEKKRKSWRWDSKKGKEVASHMWCSRQFTRLKGLARRTSRVSYGNWRSSDGKQRTVMKEDWWSQTETRQGTDINGVGGTKLWRTLMKFKWRTPLWRTLNLRTRILEYTGNHKGDVLSGFPAWSEQWERWMVLTVYEEGFSAYKNAL